MGYFAHILERGRQFAPPPERLWGCLLLLLCFGSLSMQAQTQFNQSTSVGGGTLSWTVTQSTGNCGFEGQSQYTEWADSNFNFVAAGSTTQQPLSGSPQDYSSPGGNCPPNGPQPSMLQLGGTISISGNTYTVDFYPSLNGSGSATLSEVGASGYINPKYVVVGVTYAPPGPQSNISYAGTTAVGNTATIAN